MTLNQKTLVAEFIFPDVLHMMNLATRAGLTSSEAVFYRDVGRPAHFGLSLCLLQQQVLNENLEVESS